MWQVVQGHLAVLRRRAAQAALLAVCRLAAGAASAAPVDAARIELPAAEAGMDGCELKGGERGPWWLAGFDQATDRARWVFESPGGLYRLEVRVRTPFGRKQFEGKVARSPFGGFFEGPRDEFVPHAAGLVELAAGRNLLEIGGGWGHFEIGGVSLTPAAVPPPPAAGPAVPADPQATAAARSLLESLVRGYGRRTWSGQMEVADLERIAQAGGGAPAILASDLMSHSPSMVERQGPPKAHPEPILELAGRGHVISLLWHWNAPAGLVASEEHPWWRGFFTAGTTFDVAAALADPAGEGHALLVRDIDAIAAQLAKFRDAGVPVLWRPLHEADGGWFWWGAKGADPFKRLWRLMFDRLTRHHRLHNLLWVATVEDPAWYPGDEVVDAVCIDVYPTDPDDPLLARWQQARDHYDGRKPIALGEFPGVPDIPRMRRLGIHWAWFCSWHGDRGPRLTPTAEIRRIYQSEEVVTLAELPACGQRPGHPALQHSP